MTPRQKVLRRNPEAFAHYEDGHYVIYPAPFGPMAVRPIGRGKTAQSAWLDAARNQGLAA